MKTSARAKVGPPEITWAQAWIEALGVLIPITIIVTSVWLMPVALFLLIYGLVVTVGFLAIFVLRGRRKTQKEKLRSHSQSYGPYSSGHSIRTTGPLEDLNQALILRSVQEIHARSHRLSFGVRVKR